MTTEQQEALCALLAAIKQCYLSDALYKLDIPQGIVDDFTNAVERAVD